MSYGAPTSRPKNKRLCRETENVSPAISSRKCANAEALQKATSLLVLVNESAPWRRSRFVYEVQKRAYGVAA